MLDEEVEKLEEWWAENEKENKELEKWLIGHMGEYIMLRTGAHKHLDTHPKIPKNIQRALREYSDGPRWLFESLLAL